MIPSGIATLRAPNSCNERDHFLQDIGIVAHVRMFAVPLSHLYGALVLTVHDRRDHLRRGSVVRAIKGQSGKWVAAEAPSSLLLKPLLYARNRTTHEGFSS